MKLTRVASISLNQTPLDWEGNKQRILDALQEAKKDGALVACLPEMCITGYGCEDQFASHGLQETAMQVLHEVASEVPYMIFSVGLPIFYRNALFNCAALVCNRQILGFVAKQHLAGDGLHYEPRWFKEWPSGHRALVEHQGKSYPFGDIQFNISGVKIGFEICEDAWVAERPGAALARKGVDLILNPSASHFAFGKFETRKRFVVEGSRAFGVTYVYANLLGNEAGRAIYDGGGLIASGGKLVAQGSRFSFKDFEVTSATVDIDATRTSQSRTASFHPDHDHPAEWINVDLAGDRKPFDADPKPSAVQPAPWESSLRIKEEEFTRAVSLGLFDYHRKSASQGFIVSLSGGADSAACSVLVRTMVDFGVKELGEKVFQRRVSGASAFPNEPFMKSLLTCVYQPTENSQETTLNAAREVALELGADFMVLDVDALVKGYTSKIEDVIGRKLTWEQDDITLQNIQARVRAPSAWMLANIRHSLLLSTSNRSEAAVGYCTMDGDTAGSISPIAGIDKHFLRQWLRWMEGDRIGSRETPEFPSLALVNKQAPTAELRPQEAAQTDEKDLMPYDVLDAIEECAIRDKKTPIEVFRTLRADTPDFTNEQLVTWVTRFFRLWCRNQWKRERYAPSFHVDDENLDPRSWCRFPILSGGFQRELKELRAYVEQIK